MKSKWFNKKFFIFLFLLVFFIFLFFIFKTGDKSDNSNLAVAQIKIKDQIIEVEIADTPQQHYLGLSYRLELPENFGMLFIFSDKQPRTFVMRNMNFNLDIVFIEENEIVYICHDLSSNTKEEKFYCQSDSPVDKVLEIQGGFCEKNKVEVGDKIYFIEQ